jgi:hypothetical protein
LIQMPPIPGSVRVAGFIAPTDSTDVYPVTEETYNKGGFRAAVNAAGRLAITAERRKEGMLVYQLDTGRWWQLIGGIADINWTLSSFGVCVPGFYGSGLGAKNPGIAPINTEDLVANLVQWYWASIETSNPPPIDFFWPVQGIIRWLSLHSNPIAPWTAYDLVTSQSGVPYLMWTGTTPVLGGQLLSAGFTLFPLSQAQPGAFFQVTGFGLEAIAADFLAVGLELGWNANNLGPSGAESILFRKVGASNKIWAEVNTLATGGQTYAVDTGITLVAGEPPRKYAIEVGLNYADFYIDDVLVVTITSADAGFWPVITTMALWQGTYNTSALAPGTTFKILYEVPFIVGCKKPTP